MCKGMKSTIINYFYNFYKICVCIIITIITEILDKPGPQPRHGTGSLWRNSLMRKPLRHEGNFP